MILCNHLIIKTALIGEGRETKKMQKVQKNRKYSKILSKIVGSVIDTLENDILKNTWMSLMRL